MTHVKWGNNQDLFLLASMYLCISEIVQHYKVYQVDEIKSFVKRTKKNLYQKSLIRVYKGFKKFMAFHDLYFIKNILFCTTAIFNKPGVARAVLQTHLLLIN